ncbi:hypothetical protein [Pontibacter sp. G13]|uniref:hypothetical protein n=1 Tax=Pontibacter sp. G13 TaxID=3074898 RepID=UPI00288A7E48|nr:hypothetical protein [Pontibacter sp. G13]WNJ19481.1 hypothetical protein RJD25_03220 [Pontibacter sp. G13]
MDPRFDTIFTQPENQVFGVVFYPDRIYHARYLNATRSTRYRYNVTEVRGKADMIVMKGQVYLDGKFMTNFMRIEYRGARLLELSRANDRLLGRELLALVRLFPENSQETPESFVKLHYCEWVKAYQVEIWDTLETPGSSPHHIKVLDLMGHNAEITRIKEFTPHIQDIYSIKQVELAFRENETQYPLGWMITEMDAEWDNNFVRSMQVPHTDEPSSQINTVETRNYLVDFQRGYYLHSDDVKPVRYRNAMMNEDDPERFDQNIIEMKWILQRQLGGNLVFFHEVIIPPNTVEGTHRHIGSEELYYIVEGKGFAYMGENDDPSLEGQFPTVNASIFGLDEKECKEIPVTPGSVIYTKSGGVHGIRNPHDEPLRFVAFLYHSA